MFEPHVIPFRAEMTYDLPAYKELVKFNNRHSTQSNVSKVICILLLLGLTLFYSVVFHDTGFASNLLLLYLAIFWGGQLIFFLVNRDGGIGYKRLLSGNKGIPVHYDYEFLADGIHIFNPVTNGTNVFLYSQVKSLFETENLLVIELEHKQLLPLKKQSLSGGPVSTFVKEFPEACPNAKKKQPRTLLPGKLIHGALIFVSVCVLLLSIWWSSPVQYLRSTNRSVYDSMSYRQIAGELEALGIRNIPEDIVTELESYEEYYPNAYDSSKTLSLLLYAGMGTYDQETWEWTPSECGVYWFDSEVFAVDTMYTDFLRGVRGLDSQALNFTDIQENTEKVNWELGTGLQSVSFTWNGQEYVLTGDVNYDWFDLDAANDLNRILSSQGDRQLYFAWDGGQGYLVFYGDAQWAKAFQKATGIPLSTNPNRLNTVF